MQKYVLKQIFLAKLQGGHLSLDQTSDSIHVHSINYTKLSQLNLWVTSIKSESFFYKIKYT